MAGRPKKHSENWVLNGAPSTSLPQSADFTSKVIKENQQEQNRLSQRCEFIHTSILSLCLFLLLIEDISTQEIKSFLSSSKFFSGLTPGEPRVGEITSDNGIGIVLNHHCF